VTPPRELAPSSAPETRARNAANSSRPRPT
jgi:hypothetical protein